VSTVLSDKLKSIFTRNKEDILALTLFLVLPILAFWKNFDITGLNLTFFDAEFLGAYYPDFIMGSSLLSNMGNLLWDPHNFLGIPLIGGVDRLGFFYPVKTVFYILSLIFAQNHHLFLITYFPLFHLSIAGFTTFFLLYKRFNLSKYAAFVAGLVYAFNGSLIHFIQYPNHPVGPAYFPLVLYFLLKSIDKKNLKYAIWGGVFTAPVLLSGYTPAFLYNNLFAFLLLLLLYCRNFQTLKRIIFTLAISNIIAFVFSAPELLPNLENAAFSGRQKYNLGGSSANSFSFVGIIYYVFPYLYGTEGSSNFVYGYVGIVPLMLSAIALFTNKQTIIRCLLFLAFFFFILSFGQSTFLHTLMYLLIPKFAYFRLPAYMHYLVAFPLAVLAGFGINAIEKKIIIPALAQELLKKVSFLLALTMLSSFLLKAINYQIPLFDSVIKSVVLATIFFSGGLIIIKLMYSFRKNKLYKTLLVSLIILDLFTLISAHVYTNSSRDPRIFNGSNEVTNWLKEHTQKDYSRVFLHELSARYNAANFGLYQLGGYYGLYPESYGFLLNSFVDPVFGIDPRSPLLDMIGVKYYASSINIELQDGDALKKVYTYKIQDKDLNMFIDKDANPIAAGTEFFVYENKNVFPKAFFVKKLKMVDEEEMSDSVFVNIDFEKEAIVTIPKEDLINREKAQKQYSVPLDSSIELIDYTSSKIKIQTKSTEKGFMVFSDTYYPGWVSYVDKNKQNIIKTNLYLRGIFLDEGEHIIEFVYKPYRMYLGIAISVVTILFGIGYIFTAKYRNKSSDKS